MLKSLQIKNFRGFRDLKVEPLKRVNLITGQNNTGKTAILEALVFLLSDFTPNQNLRGRLPNLFRTAGGNWNENFWKWLFYNKDQTKDIDIKSSFDNSKDFELFVKPQGWKTEEMPSNLAMPATGKLGDAPIFQLGHRPIDFKPVVFSTHPTDPSQDAVEYQRVILKRRKKQVEKLLREIDPRLEAVEALRIGDQQSPPLIYADLGFSEMIPVTQLGQGFNRLLDIYSEIVVEDAKVLLIDEIENGLHYSVMPVIWKGLFQAAKEFDVQIFATTHSWECILAADEAARADGNYDLALIRLDRVKDDIKATLINENSLSTAKELHWEMR
jgi:AAA15 family ATPase/GTPase